jgi:hypothetical protein
MTTWNKLKIFCFFLCFFWMFIHYHPLNEIAFSLCSVLYHFYVFYLSHISPLNIQHHEKKKKKSKLKKISTHSLIHSFASLLAFIFTELSFQIFIYSSFFFRCHKYLYLCGRSQWRKTFFSSTTQQNRKYFFFQVGMSGKDELYSKVSIEMPLI